MRHACRNVNYIARRQRMDFTARERSAKIFAGRHVPLLSGHRAAQHQSPFSAMHHHHVHDLVVFFRQAIGVAIEQAKAVIAIIGERFARGMIRRDALIKEASRWSIADRVQSAKQSSAANTGANKRSSRNRRMKLAKFQSWKSK